MSLSTSLEQFRIAYSKFEDSKNVLKNFGDPETKGTMLTYKACFEINLMNICRIYNIDSNHKFPLHSR